MITVITYLSPRLSIPTLLFGKKKKKRLISVFKKWCFVVPWCLMESCKSLWRWWNDEPRRGRPDLRAVGMIVNLTFESRKIQSSLHACAYKCPNVVVNSGFFFSVGKLHLCEWLFIISVRVKSQRGCRLVWRSRKIRIYLVWAWLLVGFKINWWLL